MRASHLIDQMILDLGTSATEDGEIFIPVQVSTPVFKRIIEWCESHKGEPDTEVKEDPMTRERVWFKLSETEKKFLKVPIEDLVDLMTASNYLDIKSLYLYRHVCVVVGGGWRVVVGEWRGFSEI